LYFIPANIIAIPLSTLIIYGGFVAGLNAGLIHNHWPLMSDGQFIHDSVFIEQQTLFLNLIEGNSLYTLKSFMINNRFLFDFIEIDGGHDFDTLTSDIQNKINFLKVGGLIYIDDYNSYPHALLGVNQGVDEYNWDGFDHDSTQGLFWAVKKG
jgi:hypothetical protein